MISYLSTFKAIWIALGCAALIELLLWIPLPLNYSPYSQSLYPYQYMRGVTNEQKVMAFKLLHYLGKPVEFLQAGDSSGYFGVNPIVLKQYLPGMDYLNTNCCGHVGYVGYRYIAEAFLRENPVTRYLVFSISYIAPPSMFGIGASPQVKRALISPFRVVEWLPSLQYRLLVNNLIYYGIYSNEAFYIMEHPARRMVSRSVTVDNGWFPFPNTKKRWAYGECRLDNTFSDSGVLLSPELQKFKELAEKYHAKMILMFNPISCYPGPELQLLLNDVRKFLDKNPDVISPLPLVRQYPVSLFSDPVHLNRQGAIRNSHEFGYALARSLGMAASDTGDMPAAELP